jgi:alkanesulfonate monooxygenase SsuD/methylene tetrahydromethanopterin reductase-like flavin-dependent oxidoreductase (luciferase family)
MKYGFVFPGGSPAMAVQFAREAEAAGWDGFFVWEPVWGFDAWVMLAAAAVQTSRIRLGTMITPLSRMRPWKLASETVTLDHLSNGRTILSVGLGATDTGFAAFGEVVDRKTRAELLDEGLAILTGLWRGQPFRFEGKHYHVEPSDFQPPPPTVQQPRIPIWVVGAWPSLRSMGRALRYDGLLPNLLGPDGHAIMRRPDPAELREMRQYAGAHRSEPSPFDIVMEGTTPGNDPEAAAATIRPFAEAGATWWIEAMWTAPEGTDPLAAALQRLRQGPPR